LRDPACDGWGKVHEKLLLRVRQRDRFREQTGLSPRLFPAPHEEFFRRRAGNRRAR
jgi:hypothetical protein